MAAVLRVLYWAFGALVLFVVLASLALWIASERELRRTYALERETSTAARADAVGEGRRLAKLYGCTSCHGANVQGHIFNRDPLLVRNFAPNLTLLAKTYSDAQFAQAIKQGVRPTDGRALWGMPSHVFSPLGDEELGAVLAFIRAQPVGGAPNVQEGPSLQSRLALVVNAFVPSDPTKEKAIRPAPELVWLARQRPPVDLGPTFTRGRHLTATICSECHGSDLRGDATEGGPDLVIAAAYDRDAFGRLIRTGASLDGRDLGLMSETAKSDFLVFTDTEIDAIYAYLVERAKQEQ